MAGGTAAYTSVVVTFKIKQLSFCGIEIFCGNFQISKSIYNFIGQGVCIMMIT